MVINGERGFRDPARIELGLCCISRILSAAAHSASGAMTDTARAVHLVTCESTIEAGP